MERLVRDIRPVGEAVKRRSFNTTVAECGDIFINHRGFLRLVVALERREPASKPATDSSIHLSPFISIVGPDLNGVLSRVRAVDYCEWECL